MMIRTLTAFVADLAAGPATLEAAITLARRTGAALDVFCLGVELTQPELYYTGSPLVLMPGAIEEAARQASEIEAVVRARLADETLDSSVIALATPLVGIQPTVAEAARFSDLVVTLAPYGEGRVGAMPRVVEAILFETGVPVLVVPETLPERFARIAIAWNDSPEALAAVRGALPFLTEATEVEIVVVGNPSRRPDRGDGTSRLQAMLKRHGVTATITGLAKTAEPVGAILDRHVKDSGADLMVMGAYGRSRLREAIMGGATRDTLEEATFPVLMAH